jgi:hypothetical protein
MADKPSSGMRVGVAWYRDSEWEKLRQLAADPEVLEETYAEWTKVYEDAIRQLRASGLVPERVEIDVEELRAWCTAQKCPLDGTARAAFATESLRRRSKQGLSSARFPRFWRE